MWLWLSALAFGASPPGVYVGASLGTSHRALYEAQFAARDICQPVATEVYRAGVRGGVALTDWLAVEVDGQHFGPFLGGSTVTCLLIDTYVPPYPGFRTAQAGTSLVYTPVRWDLRGRRSGDRVGAVRLGLLGGPRWVWTRDRGSLLPEEENRGNQLAVGGGALAEVQLKRVSLRLEILRDGWRETLGDDRMWVWRGGGLVSGTARLGRPDRAG